MSPLAVLHVFCYHVSLSAKSRPHRRRHRIIIRVHLPIGYLSLNLNFKRYVWPAYMGFWSRTWMSRNHSSRLSAETRVMPGGRPLVICTEKEQVARPHVRTSSSDPQSAERVASSAQHAEHNSRGKKRAYLEQLLVQPFGT